MQVHVRDGRRRLLGVEDAVRVDGQVDRLGDVAKLRDGDALSYGHLCRCEHTSAAVNERSRHRGAVGRHGDRDGVLDERPGGRRYRGPRRCVDHHRHGEVLVAGARDDGVERPAGGPGEDEVLGSRPRRNDKRSRVRAAGQRHGDVVADVNRGDGQGQLGLREREGNCRLCCGGQGHGRLLRGHPARERRRHRVVADEQRREDRLPGADRPREAAYRRRRRIRDGGERPGRSANDHGHSVERRGPVVNIHGNRRRQDVDRAGGGSVAYLLVVDRGRDEAGLRHRQGVQDSRRAVESSQFHDTARVGHGGARYRARGRYDRAADVGRDGDPRDVDSPTADMHGDGGVGQSDGVGGNGRGWSRYRRGVGAGYVAWLNDGDEVVTGEDAASRSRIAKVRDASGARVERDRLGPGESHRSSDERGWHARGVLTGHGNGESHVREGDGVSYGQIGRDSLAHVDGRQGRVLVARRGCHDTVCRAGHGDRQVRGGSGGVLGAGLRGHLQQRGDARAVGDGVHAVYRNRCSDDRRSRFVLDENEDGRRRERHDLRGRAGERGDGRRILEVSQRTGSDRDVVRRALQQAAECDFAANGEAVRVGIRNGGRGRCATLEDAYQRSIDGIRAVVHLDGEGGRGQRAIVVDDGHDADGVRDRRNGGGRAAAGGGQRNRQRLVDLRRGVVRDRDVHRARGRACRDGDRGGDDGSVVGGGGGGPVRGVRYDGHRGRAGV